MATSFAVNVHVVQREATTVATSERPTIIDCPRPALKPVDGIDPVKFPTTYALNAAWKWRSGPSMKFAVHALRRVLHVLGVDVLEEQVVKPAPAPSQYMQRHRALVKGYL